MSHSIEIVRGRARVEVEADLWGDYTDGAILQLRRAVQAACRAVNTTASRELAAGVAVFAVGVFIGLALRAGARS